jgi:hypothetical protein
VHRKAHSCAQLEAYPLDGPLTVSLRQGRAAKAVSLLPSFSFLDVLMTTSSGRTTNLFGTISLHQSFWGPPLSCGVTSFSGSSGARFCREEDPRSLGMGHRSGRSFSSSIEKGWWSQPRPKGQSRGCNTVTAALPSDCLPSRVCTWFNRRNQQETGLSRSGTTRSNQTLLREEFRLRPFTLLTFLRGVRKCGLSP